MSPLPRASALGILMIATLAAPARADDPLSRLKDLGRRAVDGLRVRPLEEAPAWALRGDEPVMRFVQLADIHHTARRHPELLRAVRFVNETLKPDWVILTGDNVTGSTIEHHAELKEILRAELRAPYRIVQGDNDSEHYTEVFGSSDWAFTSSGVRFVGLGLDYDAKGVGIGYFRKDTLSWLEEDLAAHPEQPAVLFIHEPVAPPVFLDAARVALILSRAPNACAVIAGHLHEDLEVRQGRIVHVTAPAVGPSDGHGLKEYLVYPDGMVVKTYEVDAEGRYRFADKWQRIPFPRGLRARGGNPRLVEAEDALPARETEYPAWLDRPARGALDRLRAMRDASR